jgi:DNA-binding NarL/FixJ family response regulator
LRKNTPPVKILEAIKEAMDGGAPMSMEIARMVVGSFRKEEQSADLTSREKEVLNCLCAGNSYKIIAENLCIDINTVKFHIRNIYHKLEVNSKGEAIAKAIHKNLT